MDESLFPTHFYLSHLLQWVFSVVNPLAQVGERFQSFVFFEVAVSSGNFTTESFTYFHRLRYSFSKVFLGAIWVRCPFIRSHISVPINPKRFLLLEQLISIPILKSSERQHIRRKNDEFAVCALSPREVTNKLHIASRCLQSAPHKKLTAVHYSDRQLV